MRIIYIDIDSLTPSHLGCYGYLRNTSPTIDTIANQGLRCTNTYTSDAPCLPSRTGFYSGRFGIQTGVVGHGGTAAEPKREGKFRGFRDRFDEQGLARQLQKAGLHTAMISPFGQRHAAHWFYAGFNEMHNTGFGGSEDASVVQPVVDQWLDQNVDKVNWYLHINYWDVHGVYRVPMDYGEPFKDAPLPAWLDDKTLLKEHQKLAGPYSPLDIGMYKDGLGEKFPRSCVRLNTLNDLKHWMDGYDTAIRYVDDKIKIIVDKLKAAGVYEDTAIIISADHGENQSELGIYGEHGTADQGTCNIPLIIKWPGGATQSVDNDLHYHLDLAPTLMDLLGGEKQDIWDGKSYASTILPSALGADTDHDNCQVNQTEHEQLIISQCAHVCQRSVRWSKWLYIRTYHDGFHLFDQEMLFDIDNDPRERNNLAGTNLQICQQGAWRLANWHDDQMQKMATYSSDVTDPLWTVMREGGPHHANIGGGGQPGLDGFKNYIKRLRETGRSEKADKLEIKYARF